MSKEKKKILLSFPLLDMSYKNVSWSMVCNMHLYLTELNNQIVLFLKLSDLEQKLEATALFLTLCHCIR